MPDMHVDAVSADASFWQTRTNKNLSNDDERQIKQNLVGFFSLLNEWSIKENAK